MWRQRELGAAGEGGGVLQAASTPVDTFSNGLQAEGQAVGSVARRNL